MHRLSAQRLFAATCALASLVATAAQASRFDDAVLAELNFAREHPAEYARKLQIEQVSDGRQDAASAADPAALPEAIEFLMRQPALPPLSPDDRLAAAASDHVATQASSGQVGHGQFARRMRDHAVFASLAGEDIDYGQHTPQQVVRRFIVDPGVPGRGHRTNVFREAFQIGGVSCGAHPTYGSMCVVDFAGGQAGGGGLPPAAQSFARSW